MPALHGRGDLIATSAFAFLFTVGSGVASVALPLIALAAGYGATEIGFAATLAALVQIATRANLGLVMRYLSDRTLLLIAALAQLASFAVALGSDAFVALTTAWVVQGFARSLFWTGGQTHVVRGGGSAVGVLALFNFVGGIGQFAGPLLAGIAASRELPFALVGGLVASALSVLPVLLLRSHPPFARPENTSTRQLLREPGVRRACWGSVGAGTWRSLIDSFVPVILDGARYSSSAIGAIIAVSNGAAVLGALAVGRMRQPVTPWTFAATMLVTAAGMGAVGLVAGAVIAAVTALAVAGFSAGMLQTLSPAIASVSVQPQERGEAIAISGTSRAVAMFAAPLMVTAALSVVSLGVGMLVVGVALCVPALTEARRI